MQTTFNSNTALCRALKHIISMT